MVAIGVLCARVRMEEKQIIAAIGEAGCVAVSVPPASMPLPPGPASGIGSMLGEILGAGHEANGAGLDVMIDRATNRSVAAAVLPLVRASGVRSMDAGIAATGTRVQVASALALAGAPRPESLVGFSEESAMAGAARLGFPSTLLGLLPGSSATTLHDADTADAVIEHRVVLGEASEAIMLLQAGSPPESHRSVVHVIGGRAIAASGADLGAESLSLAEQAARALQASLVAVEIAKEGPGLVIWDVHPVHDFRKTRLLGSETAAAAIARVAIGQGATVSPETASGEVQREFALSA